MLEIKMGRGWKKGAELIKNVRRIYHKPARQYHHSLGLFSILSGIHQGPDSYCLQFSSLSKLNYQPAEEIGTKGLLFHLLVLTSMHRIRHRHLIYVLILQLLLFSLPSEYAANLKAINSFWRKLICAQLQFVRLLEEVLLTQILSWNGSLEALAGLVGH